MQTAEGEKSIRSMREEQAQDLVRRLQIASLCERIHSAVLEVDQQTNFKLASSSAYPAPSHE